MRRESPRRNAGRNERGGPGTDAGGSSGVDSKAGVSPICPVAAAGVTWTVVARGWSTVDVEKRFPSLPASIGGEVVIRSRDV